MSNWALLACPRDRVVNSVNCTLNSTLQSDRVYLKSTVALNALGRLIAILSLIEAGNAAESTSLAFLSTEGVSVERWARAAGEGLPEESLVLRAHVLALVALRVH